MSVSDQATLLIVTDLDGCLLDAATYEFEAARPALRELERAGAPLVLCSSKTRPEMEALAAQLGLREPLIVENGGAIVVPDGCLRGEIPGAMHEAGVWIVPLGVERGVLVQALQEIAAETGLRLRGFSHMTEPEVESRTGLARPAAALALKREYDEPFVVMGEQGRASELPAAAERRGLAISRGGRFFHLTGGSDKGRAVRTLVSLYRAEGRRVLTAGLGDAENDLPMLLAVDLPVLVPGPDGRVDERLARALPEARVASAPGPVGWNSAVLELLRDRNVRRAVAGASG